MGELYLQHEYAIASTQLVLAMLGMGANLTLEDFARIVRVPLGFLLGLACVLVLGPLVAGALGRGLGLEPGLTAGLVLVAAVPGGTMSNVLTYFARGNLALSIALTGSATFACLVTTPLVLDLFGVGEGRADFVMPVGRIAQEIGLYLLAPLLFGMFVAARFPGQRDRFSQWCIRGCLAVIVVLAIGGASAGRVDAGSYGGITLLAMFGFALILMGAGLVTSFVARLPAADGVAIGIEAAFRNTSLAILIKASLFPAQPGVSDPFADQVFFVALLYAGFGAVVAMPPLFWHRRRVGPQAA